MSSPFGHVWSGLRLPLMCAPMSWASSVGLAQACMEAGVVAGWQGGTLCCVDEFEGYLRAFEDAEEIASKAGVELGPPVVNLPADISRDTHDGAAKLALCERFRPPLVLSSVGDPTEIVKRVHDWGGLVIHNVVSVRHAEKALAAGVDGLMLTCAGAGGLTGSLTPFAFVPKVRSIFDGLIIVAGGIATGSGIAAGLCLGADLVAMGTRFIATPQSGVVDGHREMITQVGMEDIMSSTAMNGVPVHWMRSSIRSVGLDPDNLPVPGDGGRRRGGMPPGVRPWRDIWSAGHSVGMIGEIKPVREVVEQLAAEFDAAMAPRDWQARLRAIATRIRPDQN